MSRLLFVLALPVLVAALAPAAPVPRHSMKPGAKLYYPTRIGTKWVYDEEGRDIHVTITKAEAKGEAVYVGESHTQKDGTPFISRTIAVSKKGIFRIRVRDTTDDPPLCWLRLPLESGEIWECFGDRVAAFEQEEVETPAGKFWAIPVKFEAPNSLLGPGCGKPRKSYTRWFAPDVGMVLLYTGEQQRFILKSFTPVRD